MPNRCRPTDTAASTNPDIVTCELAFEGSPIHSPCKICGALAVQIGRSFAEATGKEVILAWPLTQTMLLLPAHAELPSRSQN